MPYLLDFLKEKTSLQSPDIRCSRHKISNIFVSIIFPIEILSNLMVKLFYFTLVTFTTTFTGLPSLLTE